MNKGKIMALIFGLITGLLTLVIMPKESVSGQETMFAQETSGITLLTDEEAIQKELEGIGIDLDDLRESTHLAQEEPPKQETLEITLITDEDIIRKELESIGVDWDKLKETIPGDDYKDDSAAPEGAGGHAGFFLPPCIGPQTAYHLFETSPGPYVVTFLGTKMGITAGTCDAFPACLVLTTSSPIPSGDIITNYGVAAPFTLDLGRWCS